MTSTCPLRTITDLEPGEHLCYLYETNEELRALLVPFLRKGLEQGEKVFCIMDDRTEKLILDYLRDEGLEIEPYLKSGQLSILTGDDTYLRDSRFNPEEMIALLRTKTEQALVEGYTALRIAGEMTWALRGLPGSDRLIEYEAKLNTFFPNSKCLAICLYDWRRFDPIMLSEVLTTHPKVIIDKEVYDNFYYIPSTEFLGNDISAETLLHRLENLTKHKQTEEMLQKTKEELEHRIAQQIADLRQANKQLQREITERKWAEESLQAERDNVQQYLDVAGVILVVINEKCKVTLINKKGCEVLGYQEQEILDKDWFATFLPERIREEVKTVFQKLLAGELELVEYFKNPVLTKNGEERIIAWHNTLLTDEAGKIIGTLSSGEDITELKQAEEAQKLNDKRLTASLKLSQMEEISEKEIIEFALEEGVRLTSSKVGYLHFVNEDQESINLFSWSKEVLKDCSAEKTLQYPLHKAGVWADCVRERGPVIHNDYQSLPNKKGYPEGHFPVKRHINVPIYDGGKIVAIIGVGNKTEPYDQSDAHQLSLFIGHMWEILKRKRAELALRKSKARLAEAQRIAYLGNWDWNIITNELWWSDEIYRIFGLTPQEFGATYEAFLDSVHPDDLGFVKKSINDALYQKKPYSIDHRIVLPDGSERIVHEQAEVVFNKKGKPIRMIGTVQDITERKRAEEEIHRLNQFLGSIIDNASVWLDVLDENANVVIWNKAAEEISGYSREEVIGHDKIWEWLYPEEVYRTEVLAKATTIIEGEEVDKGDETTIRCKDGQLKIISWYSRSLVNEKGTPIGSIAIGRDITERKLAEAQILQQSAVLEAINRVFHETLTCESDEEVARTCLVVAEALTGSQFGFIDEVNPAGRVDAIALSDPGWEACRLPKSDAVALLKDMEIRSIWARVIKDGQSIIVNDPASHPDSVGTPERHPPLTAFLGIPLKYGGQTIGLIGLANKEGGYDVADQEAVEALSVAFVESLHLKRAEEALRESENTFRRTFEAIPDPAYLWERQTDSRIILTAANKAAFELSGGRITDLIGTELGSPNIPHYSYSGLGSTLKHVLDTGETRREEMRGKLRSTGEQQWFLVDYAKMAEENVLMITKDITTRKQAEKTLAKARDSLSKQVAEKTQHLLEEKNRVETIIETIPEGLLVFDMDGTLSLANKTAKEYYWNLYHEELPVGYNCLKRADNIVLETVKKIFLAQKGEVIMIEPKPGLHLQFSSAVTRVPGELPFGTIIEVRDISPFINFDTMRKQFVSSVSHELRTPISAIVQSTSNIEKYKKRLSEAQQDQLLDIISRNATLMAKLIDDLLLVSRIDEHRITVEWRKYRPLEILQDVLTELESGRKAKAIAIHVDVDKEIQLLGDRQKIGQIFRIFLDNALKYSYEQTAIKVKVIDHYKGPYNPQARDGVLLQFHDSGRGIREKDMSFLFERFFRSEDVREIPGTGLGLAIAQELTGLHEGEIFVESEFGKGSIFSVFLPRLTKLPLKLHKNE